MTYKPKVMRWMIYSTEFDPYLAITHRSTLTKLVCGIGTGYNIAQVHYIGTQVYVPPAEAGHASLPFPFGTSHGLIDTLATERDSHLSKTFSRAWPYAVGQCAASDLGLTSQDIIAEASRPDGAQDIVSCFAKLQAPLSVIAHLRLFLRAAFISQAAWRVLSPLSSAQKPLAAPFTRRFSTL